MLLRGSAGSEAILLARTPKIIKNLPSENSKKRSQSKDKKEIIKRIDSIKNNLNKIPLPSKSKISTSEFKVKSRGYVKLNGQKITLNFQ